MHTDKANAVSIGQDKHAKAAATKKPASGFIPRALKKGLHWLIAINSRRRISHTHETMPASPGAAFELPGKFPNED
jgi:hypothetical protein